MNRPAILTLEWTDEGGEVAIVADEPPSEYDVASKSKSKRASFTGRKI